MRPVMQSKLVERDGEGDCLRACVASILERDLEDLPELRPSTDNRQSSELRCWLQDQRYDTIQVGFTGAYEDFAASFTAINVPCIFSGVSPRDHQRQHAVVGICDKFDFKVIHDPHPSDDGIVGHPSYLIWLVPRVFIK